MIRSLSPNRVPLGKAEGMLANAIKLENLSGPEILVGNDNDSLNNVGTENLKFDNDSLGRPSKRLSNFKATSDHRLNYKF